MKYDKSDNLIYLNGIHSDSGLREKIIYNLTNTENPFESFFDSFIDAMRLRPEMTVEKFHEIYKNEITAASESLENRN